MATRQIASEQWKPFFDEFSRRHEGESATLREEGPDIGDQVHAEARPFVGISSDTSGSAAGSITVIVGQEAGDNVERTVAAPTQVWVREDEGVALAAAVDIEQGDGAKLILELHKEPAPEE